MLADLQFTLNLFLLPSSLFCSESYISWMVSCRSSSTSPQQKKMVILDISLAPIFFAYLYAAEYSKKLWSSTQKISSVIEYYPFGTVPFYRLKVFIVPISTCVRAVHMVFSVVVALCTIALALRIVATTSVGSPMFCTFISSHLKRVKRLITLEDFYLNPPLSQPYFICNAGYRMNPTAFSLVHYNLDESEGKTLRQSC